MWFEWYSTWPGLSSVGSPTTGGMRYGVLKMFDDCYCSADYLAKNWWNRWNETVKICLLIILFLVLFAWLIGGALFVHNQNAPSRNGLLIDSLGREVSELRLDLAISDAQTARCLSEQLERMGLKLLVVDSLGVPRPLLYISRKRVVENAGQQEE